MLFLDSSNPNEIEEITRWGVVSGITTNPLILSREARGIDLGHRIIEILSVAQCPVAVELLSETEAEMLSEAQTYRAFDAPSLNAPRPNRIVIKVPFSEVGLRVAHALAALGIPTNVTCLMSFHQAYLAALAGATYVSIFSGRIRDMGYDPNPVISETRAQIDREALSAKIIVGSVRHLHDVSQALTAGAHIVTVPPPIFRAMLKHPRTEETIREFNSAWAASRDAGLAAPNAANAGGNPTGKGTG